MEGGEGYAGEAGYMKHKLEKIFKDIKGEKRFNEPMTRYTSFRIGGRADLIIFPKNAESLKNIVLASISSRIPLLVMGCGTNLLVRDNGIRGVVVSLTKGFRNIEIIKITNKFVYTVVGAGLKLSGLIKFSLENSLGGLECLAGIPGSVGGAIMMNAGTQTGEIGDSIKCVRVMDKNGGVKTLDSNMIAFGYRSSSFPKGSIILDAEFILKKTDKRHIKRKITGNLLSRRKRQPLSLPSAGSIFKNPNGTKAYKIIDEIGMRGARSGDAFVSKKHSNFIVNKGNAAASDVIRLIHRIRRKAKAEKGISLETEIIIVGERSAV